MIVGGVERKGEARGSRGSSLDLCFVARSVLSCLDAVQIDDSY